MAIAVSDIITQARGYSPHNNPRLAVDAELIREASSIMSEMYTRHPERFAVVETVTGSSGQTHWSVDGGRVIWVMKKDGSKVYHESVTSRELLNSPGVYFVGKDFYPNGNSGDPDPASDDLMFVRGDHPAPLQAGSNVPDLFPEAYARALVMAMAMYMARKDNRFDEYTSMKNEMTELLQVFDVDMTSWASRPSDTSTYFGGRRQAAR